MRSGKLVIIFLDKDSEGPSGFIDPSSDTECVLREKVFSFSLYFQFHFYTFF